MWAMSSKAKCQMVVIAFLMGFAFLFFIWATDSKESFYYRKLEAQARGLTDYPDEKELVEPWITAGENDSELLHHEDSSEEEVLTTAIQETPDKFFLLDMNDPTNDEYRKLLHNEIPNIPFNFYYDSLNRTKSRALCYGFPQIYNLEIHNTYWQTFQLQNLTVRLYGAYYDNRSSEAKGPMVRILAMINQLDGPFPESFCQLWYDGETSLRSETSMVLEFKTMWPRYWGLKKGAFYPHLISCKVPSKLAVPKAVSLVQKRCNLATNSLKVHFDPSSGKKKRFGVCVKGLDYPYSDVSGRLIEWIELLRELGAEKIFMYELGIHPNVRKALQYYEEQSFVELTPITLADGFPTTRHFQHLAIKQRKFNKQQNELIPYNDCLYRNLYKFEYLAVIDIDELIMPQNNFTTWNNLMDFAESEAAGNHKKCPYGYASICFRNVYFPQQSKSVDPEIPDEMSMLHFTGRFVVPSKPGFATKCLHNVSEVLHLHNHFSLDKLKACKPVTLDPEIGLMYHYRLLKEKDLNASRMVDLRTQQYKDSVIKRTLEVIKTLSEGTS